MSIVIKVARVVQIIMGSVLLVAGLTKIWDPVLFYWEAMPLAQLLGMKPEIWPKVGRMAQLLGPFECGLGLALICNWRPRLAFPVATVLMAFFAGLTARAWQLGVTANCGCFGALVDRTPGEATIEDTAMLVALIFAWWGTRSVASSVWPQGRWVVTAGTVVALVVCGVRFLPEMARLDGSDLQVGVQLSGLDLQGVDIDLETGDYLVELFSPKCGRCRSEVPKLNKWADTPGLPPIVGLHNVESGPEVIAEFKKTLQPRYHIASVSFIDFRRLTWKSGYPRLALLQNGEVKAVWEHFEMPTEEQIKRVVNW
jgi:thiol-disulfide isomerase/thioredoxin